MKFTTSQVAAARAVIYENMTPTLQYAWPLICEATGTETWVKHENHTPIGAFKVRGGLVHMRNRRTAGQTGRIITATRGNHGQSIPFAAGREDIKSTIIVPFGNSVEKNAAMRALGADLVEAGSDFEEAKQAAVDMSNEQGLYMAGSFIEDLVLGVSSYAHELFEAAGALDAIYVPIGQGSGICGTITARDLLGLKTRIIGVVAERANAYALSFAAGEARSTNSSATFADGMACRVPDAEALAIINRGAERIVSVSEDNIADAIRLYYRSCHNIAEGAGAAPLAALLQEKDQMAGKRVGVILSGGNIDSDKFLTILQGRTPAP